MKRSRMWTVLAAAMALLLITTSVAGAGGNANSGVLPPNSRVHGLTYGDWLARWWQYALTLPASQNPIIGSTGANCAVQRSGNVALVLAYSAPGDPIQCEVPVGTMLFLEVLSSECSTLEPPPFYGANEAELRTCAEGFVPLDMKASIDGVEVRNLSQYVKTSPLYTFTVPEDNILGAPAGATGESVAYGVHLLLAPLTPGKHTIHVYSTYEPGFPWTADKIFELVVTRER
jgi:hypothetical protein